MPVDYIPIALGAVLGALGSLILTRVRPFGVVATAFLGWALAGAGAGAVFGAGMAVSREAAEGSEVARELLRQLPAMIARIDWDPVVRRIVSVGPWIGGVVAIAIVTIAALLRTSLAPVIRMALRRVGIAATAIPTLSASAGVLVLVHVPDDAWRTGSGGWVVLTAALATFLITAVVFSPVRGFYWSIPGADPDFEAVRSWLQDRVTRRSRQPQRPSGPTPSGRRRLPSTTPEQIDSLINSLEGEKFRRRA